MTTLLYRYIFWRLTGMNIWQYQREELRIDVKAPTRNIHIVLGSRSDLDQALEALQVTKSEANMNLHIVSCHRNPNELAGLISTDLIKADVVVVGAGKAAQLPSAIKTELCRLGRPDIPVIGVACKGDNDRSNTAAILSIEELPDQPVELDPEGHAYFGEDGFLSALESAIGDEFLPRSVAHKPAELNLDISRW